MLRHSTTFCLAFLAGGIVVADAAQAQDKKPNILVIWGDDIGT